MMASCIIIDDEPLAIRLVAAHVERIPELTLKGSFQNPVKALAYLRENPIDLLFLDIQMPALTGMEFARTLRPAPGIIFTTAYRDYAVESYELEVIDYLVKPITFPRLYQAVNKFLLTKTDSAPAHSANSIATAASQKSVQGTTEEFRYFNVNKKYVKVCLQDITYVESLKDYVRIHTTTQRLVTKEKIGDFATTLPEYFLRTHRSFLVNTRHITAFTAHDVEISEIEIPIGISYKMQVMERLRK
ncbi:MAG: response regulator transcription factor [Bacteroidota bacterium]